MRSDASIAQDIFTQLQVLDAQMTAVAKEAQEKGVNPTQLKANDGSFLMTPLLMARANLTLAEVTLKASKEKKR